MEEQIQNLNQSVPAEPVAKKRKKLLPVILVAVVILVGVASGYLFSGKSRGSSVTEMTGVIPAGELVSGKEFGAKDASAFKDTAIGVLEKGVVNGEGTHQLIREGGPSQTAFLTSSVLDLDQFEGKKVQIWGETFKAQKAGWLMDVGRVKILE